MRYLIPYHMSHEMLARKKYIFDSMHLWTRLIPYNEEFLCLEGFPVKELDIFFILGHNYKLKNFINQNLSDIYENTIVAITCDGSIDFSSINVIGRRFYIPYQNKVNNLAYLLNGSEYGFEFDLTESEIIFYNSKKDPNIISRLNSSFLQIH
ncbi:hypothetical protein SAMN02745136_00923 [Anaerocolumna jejuensis DSM 15929]|uniref:Uncharacterized protein n=1 Tax=Anaerocolumna jejuensis DSM 15929 TaxID=1121322 RepID=A0A1M6MAL1_9FIRM|nr:hypothetical protein [Anaerocolumna jejuensis]SHJ80464.1 hypothetical protein SAMN02745136_00923 [Anaerocolumna jejuensis DSM 15929]